MPTKSEHTTEANIIKPSNAVLVGCKEHTMDEKGRVSLPSSFRKVLQDTVILAPGQLRQVLIFTPEEYTSWLDALFAKEGGYDPTNLTHIKRMDYFTSQSEMVDIDKSGRIKVPDHLRAIAELGKEVIIFGSVSNASIWNKDKWNEYMNYDPAEDFFQN